MDDVLNWLVKISQQQKHNKFTAKKKQNSCYIESFKEYKLHVCQKGLSWKINVFKNEPILITLGTRNSAEIWHEFKTPHLSIYRILRIAIRVDFCMLVAKTSTYIAICRFFHFLLDYVITIHQRYRRTDGRTTDVMLVALARPAQYGMSH